MLNFGASKPRVKGGPPSLDPHLTVIRVKGFYKYSKNF